MACGRSADRCELGGVRAERCKRFSETMRLVEMGRFREGANNWKRLVGPVDQMRPRLCSAPGRPYAPVDRAMRNLVKENRPMCARSMTSQRSKSRMARRKV